MPTFEDQFQQALEAERQRRKAEGRGNWGDLSPDWVNQKRTEMMLTNANSGTDAGASGTDYKYFADLLKGYIAQGDPNQALYKQGAMADVNKTYDKGATTLKENLAGSGMLRSGVGQNAFATLEGGRANAMGGVNTQLAAQDQSFRQNALKNLLGVFGQESSQGQQWKEFLLNLQNDQSKSEWQKKYAEDQSKFNFWRDLFPGFLSAGGSMGAAALTPTAVASDKRLKENIEEVGKTKSGIPIVEFNYKDKPEVRFKGHLAQTVEKKYPNAVFKFIDYSKLPTDAIFEVAN